MCFDERMHKASGHYLGGEIPLQLCLADVYLGTWPRGGTYEISPTQKSKQRSLRLFIQSGREAAPAEAVHNTWRAA
jgi:hypothetical protein